MTKAKISPASYQGLTPQWKFTCNGAGCSTSTTITAKAGTLPPKWQAVNTSGLKDQHLCPTCEERRKTAQAAQLAAKRAAASPATAGGGGGGAAAAASAPAPPPPPSHPDARPSAELWTINSSDLGIKQANPTVGQVRDLGNPMGGEATLMSLLDFLRTALSPEQFNRPGKGHKNAGFVHAAGTTAPPARCDAGQPHIHVGSNARQANVIIDSAAKTIFLGAAQKHN